MRTIFVVLALSAFARESSPDVEIKVTRPARKILKAQGGAFEDGLLACAKGRPLDLTSGGGALVVVPHPSEQEHLAVGVYDGGKRFSAFEAWCMGQTLAITPLGLPDAQADALFPATFGDPNARHHTVSSAAREAMVESGYVMERGVIKLKGAKDGYDVEKLTGRGHISVEAKPGAKGALYAARYMVDEFADAVEVTLDPAGPKVRGIAPSEDLRKLFAPGVDEVLKGVR